MKVMLGMPTLSYNGHVLADTINIENGIIPPPPPDGQWARTGTVDSSIVRFLLPIGGGGSAEVALEAAFSYKKNTWQKNLT